MDVNVIFLTSNYIDVLAIFGLDKESQTLRHNSVC